jgi:hypothetical protein
MRHQLTSQAMVARCRRRRLMMRETDRLIMAS